MSDVPVGWIATFRNGPLAGNEHDRIFAVGDPWQEIRLAPMPAPHGWQIVGGDGIPDPDIPHWKVVPWDGEVTYRLLETVTMAGMHGEPVACYGLVNDAPAPAPPARDPDTNRYWGD